MVFVPGTERDISHNWRDKNALSLFQVTTARTTYLKHGPDLRT